MKGRGGGEREGREWEEKGERREGEERRGEEKGEGRNGVEEEKE